MGYIRHTGRKQILVVIGPTTVANIARYFAVNWTGSRFLASARSETCRPLHRSVYITELLSGLRGLEVTFPPLDPSDAGSNPVEVVEFLRTERSPPGGTSSRLNPMSQGHLWAKLRTFPVQVYSCQFLRQSDGSAVLW
jgi:hypothetical protein